ncbi:MAG: beta-ketoacyl synthase [Flavobacteriaceae bacterium]|nr:beta-ketoacyl synthase [Flavobacteriaceae bacterium]
MKTPISITQCSSISALGTDANTVWENYKNETTFFQKKIFSEKEKWVSVISSETEQQLFELKKENPKYKYLDRTVLFSILASKNLIKDIDVSSKTIGINIGSSRGATQLFETHHQEFLETGKVKTRTSPTTTLGNISSWVAQELQSQGPVLSHSITCATALQSVINGVAWLQAGMAESFIVGGSEAPLTPFTIAQMEALKLYSKIEGDLPCESMNFSKKSNTLVLGEAASVCMLEKGVSEHTKAIISGIGYATEPLSHSISITTDAQCFQRSMTMALQNANLDSVDVVIMHAPGTVKGDLAEKNAIEKVFVTNAPFLTTNKWKIGHTFGASGAMSLEMALLMLQHQEVIHNPFYLQNNTPNTINHIMINAVGFGGNAVSIIVKNK